jgi:putative ABC transport system permease protein
MEETENMLVARRNLARDKTRLALSICGVGLAIMLILLLNGFLAGMNRQVTAYLDHSPGSILVAQKGVSNLLGATSLLPEGIAAEVENVPGVSEVVPILSQFVILDLHDKKQPAYLVGYLPEAGGGPWMIAEGREPQKENEVALDSVLASRHDIRVGDKFEITGFEFSVVGLSQGTTSWMTSFFFLHKDAAEELMRSTKAISFLLVNTTEEPTSVIQSLSALDGVEAYLKSTVAENDLKLFARVFSTPLRLMVAIAFLVGSLVIGLVIYSSTVEKQREYGVLKALGTPNAILYRVVAIQALVASLAGAALGSLLTYTISWGIMSLRPQFLIILEPMNAVWAFLAGLGMAMLAAFFPARIVSRLAPAEVFSK